MVIDRSDDELLEEEMEEGTDDDREKTEDTRPPLSPLRHLENTAQSIEKARIGVSNRISALQRGVDSVTQPVPPTYAAILAGLVEVEARVDKAILQELKDNYPIWDYWLSHVKGIGPGLAGQLLSYLWHPRPDGNISIWHKSAGLNPELRPDGTMRMPRARKGEGRVTYHRWLRRCLYNVTTSFVRNGGYYREVYNKRKARLALIHEGDETWPKYRVDKAARWATLRIFLSHLWMKWLESEGITPIRMPYVVEHLGHHYIPPPEWNGKTKM